MEDYATRCAEWIEKQVRAAEERDPKFRSLKDRVNQLTEQIKATSGDQQVALLHKQDQAIRDLLNHVASRDGG